VSPSATETPSRGEACREEGLQEREALRSTFILSRGRTKVN